jgi:hypothetical protein
MEDLGLTSGTVLFLLLAQAGCVLLRITRSHCATLRFQTGLFLTAYVLRFVLSLVIYGCGLVQVIRDEDGSGWLTGVGLHQRWVDEGVGMAEAPELIVDAFRSSNKGYYFLLALLYHFVEPTRLPAAVINGFCGALAIIFAYRTAASLFTDRVARRVGIWLCVFPSLALWSAQTVKEPVVILLETMAVYGCVRLRQSVFPLSHLALTVVCVILLVPFRFYAAYFAAAALIASSIFPASGRDRLCVGPRFGAGLLVVFFVTTGLLAHHEAQYAHWDLDNLQRVRSYTARTTGSGFESSFDVRTPVGFGLMLTVGALHLLLAPFPWQLLGGSLRMLLVAPEMLYWWWLVLVGVIPGLWDAVRHRFNDVLPLLVMLVGFGVIYSLTFSNVGLIYRQRAQFLPWLLVFAAVSLERRRYRQRTTDLTRGSCHVGLQLVPNLEPTATGR